MNLPQLRAIDMVPMEHEGEQQFCMHDPAKIVEGQLLLSPSAAFVASMLDGNTSAEAIQRVILEQSGGEGATIEQILEIVEQLDHAGFLHTDRFDAIFDRLRDEFQNADGRPAYLAGKSYPEDGEELRSFLKAMFLRDTGPGEEPGDPARDGAVLPGLIVPHIDFGRGGHSYAHAYYSLAEHAKPDTVFVFGVAHVAEPVPFILTRKAFDTPLGRVEVDHDIIDQLEASCAWDPYEFELTHRTEHSIEFQAVMLAYLYGADVKIVPILCSVFGEEFLMDRDLATDAIDIFLDTCKTCVASPHKKVTVVAAADLAHVGRRFGDAFDIDDEIVDAVAKRDHEDLVYAEALDPEGFYSSVMRDDNNRKVCGINCIYSVLSILEGRATIGERLHYDYAHDPAGGIVSFASMAFRA